MPLEAPFGVCSRCQGHGYRNHWLCRACDGSGRVLVKEPSWIDRHAGVIWFAALSMAILWAMLYS